MCKATKSQQVAEKDFTALSADIIQDQQTSSREGRWRKENPEKRMRMGRAGCAWSDAKWSDGGCFMLMLINVLAFSHVNWFAQLAAVVNFTSLLICYVTELNLLP